jgi:hypothetical protein
MMGACGCTPALNWRQVATDDARVQLLLPCKPEQATRDVVLRVDAHNVSAALQLQGCEASELQFTFGRIALPDGMPASDALAAWRAASLAPLLGASANANVPETWALNGAQTEPAPVRMRVLTAQHQMQGVWFAHAGSIYQAAVYGQRKDKGLPEAAEAYFSGIQLP